MSGDSLTDIKGDLDLETDLQKVAKLTQFSICNISF